MFLAINVGNTNVRFGVFSKGRLQQAFVLPTPGKAPNAAWKRRLAQALAPWTRRGTWEGAAGATVVPRVRPALDRLLQTGLKTPVRWVTSTTPMPVKNGYRPPRALGVDRLLNAVGAQGEFGVPLIIVDAGTAITVDAVDARGIFLGGAILPGPELSLKSLAQSTALLPLARAQRPASMLGRTTQAGLQAGVVAGTAAAVAALVAGMRRFVGPRAAVVGTGGALENGTLAIPAVRCLRPHAALQGLHRLWQDGRVPARKERAR